MSSNIFITQQNKFSQLRENNKRELMLGSLSNSDTFVLYMFSFVQYATKEQLIQFASLPKNTNRIKLLYMNGYVDAGRIANSKWIYWIDERGIQYLKSKVSVEIRNKKFANNIQLIQHTIGAAQAIVEEMRFGYDTMTTEFKIGGVRPDLYIERKGKLYFIEFDNGTETYSQLRDKFMAYSLNEYIAENDSYLRIYWFVERNPNQRLDLIKKALKSVDLSVFNDGLNIQFKFIDLREIFGLLKEESIKKMNLVFNT